MGYSILVHYCPVGGVDYNLCTIQYREKAYRMYNAQHHSCILVSSSARQIMSKKLSPWFDKWYSAGCGLPIAGYSALWRDTGAETSMLHQLEIHVQTNPLQCSLAKISSGRVQCTSFFVPLPWCATSVVRSWLTFILEQGLKKNDAIFLFFACLFSRTFLRFF